MKPEFSNLPIECWIHSGKVGLQRPTLCLFHREAGQGAELLNALNEISSQSRPAQRVLTFAASTRESAIRRLKLLVVDARDELKLMSIRGDGQTATIEMTEAGLNALTKAFSAWLGGAEDFGVSSRSSLQKDSQLGSRDRESAELWFWGPGYAGP